MNGIEDLLREHYDAAPSQNVTSHFNNMTSRNVTGYKGETMFDIETKLAVKINSVSKMVYAALGGESDVTFLFCYDVIIVFCFLSMINTLEFCSNGLIFFCMTSQYLVRVQSQVSGIAYLLTILAVKVAS